VAKPLTDLVRNENGCKFTWTDDVEGSFDGLKRALSSPSILAMPTDDGEYVLGTDAALYAIEAVLCQILDNVERVMA
jgi:RNase H-like domain found in reverse transcriptase